MYLIDSYKLKKLNHYYVVQRYSLSILLLYFNFVVCNVVLFLACMSSYAQSSCLYIGRMERKL